MLVFNPVMMPLKHQKLEGMIMLNLLKYWPEKVMLYSNKKNMTKVSKFTEKL